MSDSLAAGVSLVLIAATLPTDLIRNTHIGSSGVLATKRLLQHVTPPGGVLVRLAMVSALSGVRIGGSGFRKLPTWIVCHIVCQIQTPSSASRFDGWNAM